MFKVSTSFVRKIIFLLCLFFHKKIFAKEVPLLQVEVLEGTEAHLPCDVSSTEKDNAASLVLWYRQDMGTPVYSLDGRRGYWERWSSEEVFGNRAHFWANRTPAVLALRRVSGRDAALYRCRVDFRIAQTRNANVNLTVIVPPTRLVIEDEAGRRFSTVAGPFSEGDTLHLRCDVFGGNPAPEVQWFRDDEEEAITGAVSALSGGKRAVVVLTNLQREDLNTRLRCRASNTNLSSPLEDTVIVDMNLSPLDVRLLGASQALSAGRRYDLLCQSSGSRPPAKVTWWLNGQRQQHSKLTTSLDGNTTTSTLSFVPSKEDDSKYIACQAENPIIYTGGPEDGVKLQVNYVPETSVVLGPNLVADDIREGTDVYFDCVVRAQPRANRVQWLHDGQLLRPGPKVILSNQSLVLQAVGRAGRGNYTCVAVNDEGAGQSRPFLLDVLYAPVCRTSSRSLAVSKKERVNITCPVDANPSPSGYRWAFNSSGGGEDLATEGTASIISYTPVTDLDFGHLLCWAVNHVGKQKTPCINHIVPAGRPDRVHNCSLANISTGSFNVHCQEGFNGGLSQTFLLQVREANRDQILKVNNTSKTANFSVEGLASGERYTVSVYAFNPKGRSEPVHLQASTLHMPEQQTNLSEPSDPQVSSWFQSPALWLVLAVLVAMVAMAAAIAMVSRMCRSQSQSSEDTSQQEDSSQGTVKTGGKLLDPGGMDALDPDIITHACLEYDTQSLHLATVSAGSPIPALQRRRGSEDCRRYLQECPTHSCSRTSLYCSRLPVELNVGAVSFDNIVVHAHESTV